MSNLFGLSFKGVVFILGGAGSGKTEISVNLSLSHVNKGIRTNIVDLDLVNPYFRAREVRFFLGESGVNTILPSNRHLYADLPILSPAVSGIVKNFEGLSILDVGGGGVGSKVLGSLDFDRDRVESLFVVNLYRPYSKTLDGCLKMIEEIEFAGKTKISGIVGNSNTITETSFKEIFNGYEFVLKLSEKLMVPVSFITIPSAIINTSILRKIELPVLSIDRYLIPPWS